MAEYPKDSPQRRIGSRARGIVHYAFSKIGQWEFHEATGNDFGIDCYIELSEDGEFCNKKFEGQIKGTTNPKRLKQEKAFSFSMDAKTIIYGLSSHTAFVLLYVDVNQEVVYYLPIQDYFISRPEMFKKLDTDQKTINIHIPLDNVVLENDFDLVQIAKSTYVDGPTSKLRKV